MSKRKGTRYERELFHMFHNTGKFMPVRAAGSGSTTIEAPDLIIGSKNLTLAIECKALKKGTKYFKEGEIEQLLAFSERFGANPLVGMRYDNLGWFFINANKIPKTKNGVHHLSQDLVQKKGVKFEQLVDMNEV